LKNITWPIVSTFIFLLIVFLSFYDFSLDDGPPLFPNIDKLGHFVLYGMQFSSLVIALNKNLINRAIIFSFGFCLLLGISIEFLQPIISPNRMFDILDIIANLSGILIAFFLLKNFRIT
tara:strand:+ start:7949 stop:8305 length:357 start_codon:yes stop_codon:yes gene_type:complete